MTSPRLLPMFFVIAAFDAACVGKAADTEDGACADDCGSGGDPCEAEICDNGVDDDCDGLVDADDADDCRSDSGGDDNSGWYVDADGDGYQDDVDCDDHNQYVHPGAREVCDNGDDDDCDGLVDTEDTEDCPDEGGDYDGDGYDVGEDCDDDNAEVYPGAPEVCDNGIDDDCDALIDADDAEDCPDGGGSVDLDGDGYDNGEDCDDANPEVYPGAPEVCDNGIDDDCDGLVDGDDTEDCPEGESGGASTDRGPGGGAVGTRLPPGLDWAGLSWCAPESEPAGLRAYRRAPSPFVVGGPADTAKGPR